MHFLKQVVLTVWNILLLFESAVAFIPAPSFSLTKHSTPITIIMTPKAPAHSPISVVVAMAVDESEDETTSSTSAARVEPGTHDELMYTLGVNLARQLGDIRPLVNDGLELANVAKGLLDTVLGRLDDEGQRMLLASRGKELDDLIVSRA
jgi:hypothetical protein